MKHPRTLVVVILLAIALAWWFLAQKENPATTNTAPKVKPSGRYYAPAAAPTVVAPKAAPATPMPPVAGTAVPAPEGPPPVPTTSVTGELPSPGTPGPKTEWGEVSFTDGVPVNLRLVTGQSAIITPRVHDDGSVDLHVQIHYPTENDLLSLPVITANSGEPVSIPFYDFEAKLIPVTH